MVGNAGANTLALAESLGLRDKIRSVRYGEPSAKNRMIKVRRWCSSFLGLEEFVVIFLKGLKILLYDLNF